jgi:hypothetical protein
MYPVLSTDIYFKENGDTCFSERYLNEVVQVKIERFGK